MYRLITYPFRANWTLLFSAGLFVALLVLIAAQIHG